MSYRETDIVHETADHVVLRVAKGFEVYKRGATAMTRCGIIGYSGDEGLKRALAEVERREKEGAK